MSIQTKTKAKQAEQDLIAQQTAEFLAKGGKIRREKVASKKTDGLTWRNYASASLQEAQERDEA